MLGGPVWHLKEGCGQMVSITADTVVSNWVSMMLFFCGAEYSDPVLTIFIFVTCQMSKQLELAGHHISR